MCCSVTTNQQFIQYPTYILMYINFCCMGRTGRMHRTEWHKIFLGIGITQMSSRMLFTSIPRYSNSLTVSKDILKRISITWNCKCCYYSGSYFARPVSSSPHKLF